MLASIPYLTAYLTLLNKKATVDELLLQEPFQELKDFKCHF